MPATAKNIVKSRQKNNGEKSIYQVIFSLPPEYITTNKRILGGKPLLAGTRIPVELIFDLLAKGWSIYELPAHYPDIDVSLVEQLVKYRSVQEIIHGTEKKGV